MITISEWKAMSGKEQTLWLEENCRVNSMGRPRGLVQAVGVNDAPYRVQPVIGGKKVKCPAYGAWKDMLARAYSQSYHARRQTYSGVTVCDKWHSLMSFRLWWIENQVDGYEIDKDILSDSREYSPEASLFVPGWLNLFITDHGAARGAHQIGVHYNKGKGRFVAQCCNPTSRKQEHIGYFDTPEAAHLAWRARKLELALELKPRMDEIDLRIYPRVVEIINSAK